MNKQLLDGDLFVSMMRAGSANLGKNRTIVNDLNVFPIPDGDTGDNMYMTVEAGCHAVAELDPESLSGISSGVAHGMLLGARGNSGVILSRIFAGIAERFRDCECADVRVLGEALSEGVKQAYSAVTVPVEGTILTVYRDAVEYANSKIEEDSSLQSYFECFCGELRRSLERTPELLEVLKTAGVVDSGGAGFYYIAEGMKRVLDGEITEAEIYSSFGDASAKKKLDMSLFNENSEMKYGYCTEFLLQLQKAKTDIDAFDLEGFTSYLNSIGDSVVAFKDGSVVKIHVHTMTPGAVLNKAQLFGEFLTLKIENMTLQHSESTVKNGFIPTKANVRKKYAIIAVACGEGVSETFYELGADHVVSGGQSMNPAAEDFIEAFDKVNADTIFVLPNNGNILLTAKQAASLYENASVRVIGSKTIGDGYAALSMYDTSSDDADTIESELFDAMDGVVTGEVSMAIRDYSSGEISVSAGEYIGFVGSDIRVSADNGAEAAELLADKLISGRDVLIILCGEKADSKASEALHERLCSKYKKTEIIMLDGGQAVYDYILIFE